MMSSLLFRLISVFSLLSSVVSDQPGSAFGTAVFQINRNSTDLTTTVTVNFTTASSTAIAGQDYAATAGSVTFGPGETTKTVSVPIIAGTDPAVGELAETFFLQISSSAPATDVIILNTAAGATISADPLPVVSMSALDATTTDDGLGTSEVYRHGHPDWCA